MITEGHLTAGALVFCIASLIGPVPLLAQTGEPAGTSLLDVLLFGFEMPPAAGIPGLSADAEKSVGIYRLREMRFKPRVKFPGSLDSDGPEDIIYQKHVAMERTVFSLFDTPESGRLAAEFAQNLLLLYEWEGDGGRPLAEATSADDFWRSIGDLLSRHTCICSAGTVDCAR